MHGRLCRRKPTRKATHGGTASMLTSFCPTNQYSPKKPYAKFANLANLAYLCIKINQFMQPILTIDEIKAQYPDQWVLVGNPILKDLDTLEAIINKLVQGVVLFASKDKREIAYKAKDLREGYEGITCVYTGEMPRNRKWLL